MDELIADDLLPLSEADQLALDIRNGDAVLIIEGASRKFGLLFFGALGAAVFLHYARLSPSDPFWRTGQARRARPSGRTSSTPSAPRSPGSASGRRSRWRWDGSNPG